VSSRIDHSLSAAEIHLLDVRVLFIYSLHHAHVVYYNAYWQLVFPLLFFGAQNQAIARRVKETKIDLGPLVGVSQGMMFLFPFLLWWLFFFTLYNLGGW